MDTAEQRYCRLCAGLKHHSKLLNLQLDEEKREETVKKLTRVNAATDFLDELLPKTVCFDCLNSLNSAFDFVQGTEHAQGILSRIFFVKNIKEESLETIIPDDINTQQVQLTGVNNAIVKHEFFVKEVDPLVVIKQEANKEDLPSIAKDRNTNVTQETYKKADETLKQSDAHNESKKKGSDSESESKTSNGLPLSQFKLTWNDYNWMCSHCDTQFTSGDDLISHSIKYHNCCNAYKCPDCKARKQKMETFLCHIKKHRKYLTLFCYKCNKKFKSAKAVNVHAKEHFTGHTCEGCHTSFNTQEELDGHIKSVYQPRELKPLPDGVAIDGVTCGVCRKAFTNNFVLRRHVLLHTDRKPDHTCDICGKCFFDKQRLACHIILHDDARPHKCEICKVAFKTRHKLREHVNIHDNKKPYSCETCGNSFRRLRDLNQHSVRHSNDLSHVCSQCNKGFRLKKYLALHMRQHTGDKPYSCEICQRKFTYWPNYNKHMKTRHKINTAKKKRAPDATCPIDPNTGEAITPENNMKLEEWKKQILSTSKLKRPKLSNNTSQSLTPAGNKDD